MKYYCFLFLFAFIAGCNIVVKDSESQGFAAVNHSEIFQPSWSSLRKHNTPSWFEDMKFGIYFHWGPQSLQNQKRNLNLSRLEAYEHWKGEKFDAKAWVDLMEMAGAQFGGPVAWHCSGVVNWDSQVTEWNSTNKGPKVDIFGLLATELRKRDMKVLSSFHTCNVWDTLWGPIADGHDDYLDPKQDNSDYGLLNYGRTGDKVYDGWFARISEAIEKYQPDVVWLDTGFGGTVPAHKKGAALNGRLLSDGSNKLNSVKQRYQQKLIAYYFNKALEWNKEVEVTYKSHDIPPGIGMRDIEDGNLDGLQYDPWIADIDMAYHREFENHWFFNTNNPMKTAGTLVDLLVDITSKNGRMLLNVPPKADGTFSDEQIHELSEMGKWLEINGEAIYGTVPWVFYGEGPTEIKHIGHHAHNARGGRDIPVYTHQDIRFTTKDNVLYATSLDWGNEKLVIRALGSNGKLHPGDIKRVSLLGYDASLDWQQLPEGLEIILPIIKPGDYAHVFKIQLE